MSDVAPVERESHSRRVWQLAWPSILSNLLFTTVGFMHIKIVAELGTSAVAAVTTGHRVFFLIQAVLMGVSIAATAMISRAWGADDIKRAEMDTWTALTVSIALAAALSLPALLIPEQIAGLFGLDDATTKSAGSFIFWLGVFNVATAVNMMLQTALRATGDVITPLWILSFSTVLNISFGYCLAYGVGPLPTMGVAGVALGGSSAATLVTIVFAIFWWRGRFNIKPVKRLTIDWLATRRLAAIGMPSVIEQGVVQLAFLLFFGIVAQYGTAPYAAYGIGISLVSFPIVVGFGFGIAAATLVGQQLGAGRPEAAVAVGWRSLRMAVASMTGLSIILAYYSRDLATFMIDDPEVVEYTVAFIYMIAAAQPMMACEVALAGSLRGAGDTRFPLMATFCGLLLGRLLPAWLFASLNMSVYWIFAVMLFDYSLKAILLIHRYRSRKWLNIKVHATNTPQTGKNIDSDKKNT
ncbi:MAG: MATE family efflux transporter [Halieaceae bacterium]